ncbi:antitoxin [bacterium]|nr:antitoxin [bacterium]
MKYDDYEKEIIESYENDEWKPIKNFEEEKERYAQYARNTFNKNKRINIRLSEKDLKGIKVKSLEEGMPYQTLISSIIHKYINGHLTEKAK